MINNLLTIGIDNYQKVNKLNNCVKDLENIVDLLVDRYNFDKDKVTRLYDNDATQENIINNLEDFYARQSSGENLIIFYSGHGEFDNKLDLGYFLPVDTILYNKATYIPNSTVFNYVRAFEYRHVVLISDSCFSGSLFSATRAIQTSNERLYEIPSKWALTSGRIEKVSDGIPGKNSPFATSILKNLADNTDNYISISELTQKVVREVADNNKQIPRGAPLQMFGDKGGEFIFKLKSKPIVAHKAKLLDENENEQLKALFNEYYTNAELLEDAENQNKSATVRRLTEELKFVENAISRELVKLLELEKSKVLSSKKIQSILGNHLEEKYKEVKKLNEQKNLVVRNQQFDKAAAIRDKEKAIQAEMFKLIVSRKKEIIDIIASEENQIASDFGILSILTDIAPSNDKTVIRRNIDREFISIMFLKLSKDFEKITQIRFQEKYMNFQKKIIPQIISDIISNKPSLDYGAIAQTALQRIADYVLDEPPVPKKITKPRIPKKK